MSISLLLNNLIDAATLCEAVYHSDETAVAKINDLLPKVTVKPFHVKDTDGAVLIDGNNATIVFRGTENKADVLSDIDVRKTKAFGGKAHKGFYEAYYSVKPSLLKTLQDATVEYISVCGHSLGGGISVIASRDLLFDYIIGSVMTFGSPRVFDRSAAREYDERLGTRTYSVINASDPVPRVPSALRFSRVGQICFIPAMLCHLKPGDQPFADWNWKTRLKSLWQDVATGGGAIGDHYISTYLDRLKTLQRLESN